MGRVILENLAVVKQSRKSRLLWNAKVHGSVHNSPSLDSILSQINPIHSTMLLFFKISFLIFSSHIRLGLTNSLVPFSFPD
jgi:hypothetical protein